MTVKHTPANVFKWRDRNGVKHAVTDMETRHLFYTLRMIWNHTMPGAYRLPGNLYSFGSYYSEPYMLKAVRAITLELAGRTDMTAEWKRQLKQMSDWLATPQLQAHEHRILK